MKLRQIAISIAAIGTAALATQSMAAPIELDQLYDPFYGNHVKTEGYLRFINPTEDPGFYPAGIPLPSTPPGVIQTEEYTGYTQSTGRDVIELGDSDTSAGDRADFDWVQENRSCETTGVPAGTVAATCNNTGVRPGGVNHPGQVGAMGWTIGPTTPSLHVDPGAVAPAPHDDGAPGTTHSDEQVPAGPLPHLVNGDFAGKFFNAVDVFSIISIGQDDGVDVTDLASRRAAALDYVVDFKNSVTGAFSPGVLNVIWIPGWTAATYIDDFVARWVPVNAGVYDIIAIEPDSVGDVLSQRTEIDAVKAAFIPEPGSVALLGLGLAALALGRRRLLKA